MHVQLSNTLGSSRANVGVRGGWPKSFVSAKYNATSGRFYTLPQQFKQLLIVDETAQCFRGENISAEKQPEFTQVDREMSFCNGSSSIKPTTEKLLKYAWLSKEFDDCVIPKTKFPLQTFDYRSMISTYGSDRPDTRFGSVIHDITHHVGGLELFQQEARRAAATKPNSSKSGNNDGFVFAFQTSATAQHVAPSLRKQWKNDQRACGNYRLISFCWHQRNVYVAKV